MFRAITQTQWESSRGFVFIAAVAVFALPPLSLRAAGVFDGGSAFLNAMSAWSVGYSVAAAAIGLMIAILAWVQDHRGRHVYAMALPVARWHYVLMRLAAGALFLAPIIVAIFVSAELVARIGRVPTGLHAYPVALTLRFAFACLVAYAIFFAIASATGRTAGFILAAMVLVVLVQYLLWLTNINFSLMGHVMDAVFAAPGVLGVFGGRWMLIDA